MLYGLVVNFLCEARLVDEVPIRSLLEIINHDGTFLYHLMKRLGVDVSSIHNRLYHRSHTKANILSNHEIMLAFIATSGISPTLLPAPKVLYSATKEGVAANLIYQVLRCIYRKRIRQGENYIIKMANYLNALYALRSEPVYQLTGFSKHTSLPSSLVKLSLSTSCISFSIFVAGVHRFLSESGVPCADFLTNFYRFPTTLQHMTRNHAKMQYLLAALGVPLFFSPLAWLSIKDEEPYFDLRLIQIYLIFDKFRGCVSSAVFKKLKTVLFAPRSLDPALPHSMNLLWRDSFHDAQTDLQDGLLAFAKAADLDLNFTDMPNDSDVDQDDSRNNEVSIPVVLSPHSGLTMGEDDCGNTLPKILPHEAEHLMIVLSELPEPSKNVSNQGSGSPTHYREERTYRMRNMDPISATHPIYSDEEHYKLVEARSHKSSAPTYASNVIEEEQCIVNQTEPVDHDFIAGTEMETDQALHTEPPLSTEKQLEHRIQKLLDNAAEFTSDLSEPYELPTPARPENKENSEEDCPTIQERRSSKRKDSYSPPGALHMQVHRIHDDTMRHKSSLPHPCSMSPSAHRLSDECIQRSFRNHHEAITDSEDEVCSTITPDQIREKYHICFVSSPAANAEQTLENIAVPSDAVDPTAKEQNEASDHKQDLCIRYSETEDDGPSLIPPPPPPPVPSISHSANQASSGPNLPRSDNLHFNKIDDRSSTDTQEYDLSEIILKNDSSKVIVPDPCTQTCDADSQESDNFQFNIVATEQGQTQLEYHVNSQDALSGEDFRLARAGLLPQSGSGKITSSPLQTIDSLDTATADRPIEQRACEPPLSHGGTASPSHALAADTILSSQHLDKEAIEAQECYIARFPIKIQKYIRENHLIALSALPPSLLKGQDALPADLTRTFVDANGHLYRLYGLDFIRISVDGSVHVEPDEDLESDYRALQASLLTANAIAPLMNHDAQSYQTDVHGDSRQLSTPPSNPPPAEQPASTDFLVPQYLANYEEPSASERKPNDDSLPPIQTLCVALPTSNVPISTRSDSPHILFKHTNILQKALPAEAEAALNNALRSPLTEKPKPTFDEHLDQENTHLSPNNDIIVPLVCLDDLGDAGEVFLDAEIADPLTRSNHVVVQDISLPTDLDDHEACSAADGPSSVFSAQSMRKSIGISSASSKRSLNPMLSISSYISRPNSSHVDREVPCAHDMTELAIAITEVPNDPIMNPVESPTTDRLVTAHGPRRSPEQNASVTPDPSTVCMSDEQSRPSTSSVAFTFATETQTVPLFDLTPQIQLENLLTSKFMDQFIDSYLKKLQFKMPSMDKCIAANADIDINVAKEDETSPATKRLGTTSSLKQKLNQYVRSANYKTKARNDTATTASQEMKTKTQPIQRQAINQHTIRAAHLSTPTSTSTSTKHAPSPSATTHTAEKPFPLALCNLSKEQMGLYHQINDGAHLNDNSPQLNRKLRSNKLTFSVPIRSPVQRFMYTLKCLNMDSTRVGSEVTLFSVLRNNNSGFYLGIYARQYIVFRVEVSDIYKIERNLCQVYLHFRRAFIATGDSLLFVHLDLLDDRSAQSFVKDLTAAVEIVRPLISER